MTQSDVFQDDFGSWCEEDFEKSEDPAETEHRWPFTKIFGVEGTVLRRYWPPPRPISPDQQRSCKYSVFNVDGVFGRHRFWLQDFPATHSAIVLHEESLNRPLQVSSFSAGRRAHGALPSAPQAAISSFMSFLRRCITSRAIRHACHRCSISSTSSTKYRM